MSQAISGQTVQVPSGEVGAAVGAIGLSGFDKDNDVAIAEAAADAVK